MLAVSHGRVDTVQMLLQVGADVNIQVTNKYYLFIYSTVPEDNSLELR